MYVATWLHFNRQYSYKVLPHADLENKIRFQVQCSVEIS